jgi:hypothetical protein
MSASSQKQLLIYRLSMPIRTVTHQILSDSTHLAYVTRSLVKVPI